MDLAQLSPDLNAAYDAMFVMPLSHDRVAEIGALLEEQAAQLRRMLPDSSAWERLAGSYQLHQLQSAQPGLVFELWSAYLRSVIQLGEVAKLMAQLSGEIDTPTHGNVVSPRQN